MYILFLFTWAPKEPYNFCAHSFPLLAFLRKNIGKRYMLTEKRCSWYPVLCHTTLGPWLIEAVVSNLSVQGNQSRCESVVLLGCFCNFVSGENDEKPKLRQKGKVWKNTERQSPSAPYIQSLLCSAGFSWGWGCCWKDMPSFSLCANLSQQLFLARDEILFVCDSE